MSDLELFTLNIFIIVSSLSIAGVLTFLFHATFYLFSFDIDHYLKHIFIFFVVIIYIISLFKTQQILKGDSDE